MSRSRDLANLANNASGLETLTVSDITDLTATAAELNYTDGVGSAIQTQINAKAPIASPTFTGTTTVADFVPATPLSHRNMIINGDMRVAQRGTSAVTSSGTGGNFPVDRFNVQVSTDGAFSAQQVSESPADFNYSLKYTVSGTDTSLGATQYAYFRTQLEGQDIAHLNWGSSDAKTVTVSFYIKSSVTGTFGGAVWNGAFNRSYPFSYTVSSTNWERKSITIPGDTTGTWATDNTTGMSISPLASAGATYTNTAGAWVGSGVVNPTGATNIMNTNGATYHVTGVQLELGSVATPFEHRSYGDELQRCLRYFYKFGGVSSDGSEKNFNWYFGVAGGTAYGRHHLQYPVQMRAVPLIQNISTEGSTTGVQFLGDKSVNFYANSLSSITKVWGADINAEL
ncbi:putative carbohydrate binding domain containing protein [uncultured Mediterranean phage uvMED]|nr:putative carbohydrate binding domain containing protein [uncultured Mediterranean phage uvMED]